MTSSGDGRYQVWHHRLHRGDGARAHPCLRPIADLTQRTPFFCQEDFHYDTEREVYLCPRGKELRLDRPHSPERSLRYRARAKECNHCPLKAQGTTSTQGRTLCRSVDEEYLDRVRGYHETEAYKKLYRKRSV